MRCAAAMLAAGAALAAAPAAAVEQLAIDLSRSEVEITTGFVGSELVLFGATDGRGDVVVVARGPEYAVTVRRKDRVAGIWLNRDQHTFDNVPAFYAVAASRPLDTLLTSAEMIRHEIGIDAVAFASPRKADVPDPAGAFRSALVRIKRDAGLYTTAVGQVRFVGPRLFRTEIKFPVTVPVGSYNVTAFRVLRGKVVDIQTTRLQVRKIGFEAGVYDFAHRYSFAYGVLAIVIAAVAGWLAGTIFQKA